MIGLRNAGLLEGDDGVCVQVILAGLGVDGLEDQLGSEAGLEHAEDGVVVHQRGIGGLAGGDGAGGLRAFDHAGSVCGVAFLGERPGGVQNRCQNRKQCQNIPGTPLPETSKSYPCNTIHVLIDGSLPIVFHLARLDPTGQCDGSLVSLYHRPCQCVDDVVVDEAKGRT